MSAPAIKNGGPAFPQVPTYNMPEGIISINVSPGMALRDWFAGQALAGSTANPDPSLSNDELAAAWCYRMADAMLAAREGGQSA